MTNTSDHAISSTCKAGHAGSVRRADVRVLPQGGVGHCGEVPEGVQPHVPHRLLPPPQLAQGRRPRPAAPHHHVVALIPRIGMVQHDAWLGQKNLRNKIEGLKS